MPRPPQSSSPEQVAHAVLSPPRRESFPQPEWGLPASDPKEGRGGSSLSLAHPGKTSPGQNPVRASAEQRLPIGQRGFMGCLTTVPSPACARGHLSRHARPPPPRVTWKKSLSENKPVFDRHDLPDRPGRGMGCLATSPSPSLAAGERGQWGTGSPLRWGGEGPLPPRGGRAGGGAPLSHQLQAKVPPSGLCLRELIKGLPPSLPPSPLCPGRWLFSGGPELVRLPSLAGGGRAGSPPTGASEVGAAAPFALSSHTRKASGALISAPPSWGAGLTWDFFAVPGSCL